MRKFTCVIAMFLCFASLAQVKSSSTTIKKRRTVDKQKIEFKTTTLGFGVGLTRSVIFLSRNIREYNDATGINFGVVYGGNNLTRLSAEFCQYKPINMEPTWYDINAKTYEVNVHFLARFKNNKSLIYPLVGLSMNDFKAFFTGRDDFQNLRDKFAINTRVHSIWFGANFGLGYEFKLGPLKGVVQYKMRVGAQDMVTRLNIMDVCWSGGLRYDIKALTPKYVVKTILRTYRPRYNVD